MRSPTTTTAAAREALSSGMAELVRSVESAREPSPDAESRDRAAPSHPRGSYRSLRDLVVRMPSGSVYAPALLFVAAGQTATLAEFFSQLLHSSIQIHANRAMREAGLGGNLRAGQPFHQPEY